MQSWGKREKFGHQFIWGNSSVAPTENVIPHSGVKKRLVDSLHAEGAALNLMTV